MTSSIARATRTLAPGTVADIGRSIAGPRDLCDHVFARGRGFPRRLAAAWLLALLCATVLAPRPAAAQTGAAVIAGKVWRDLDRNGVRENEEVSLGVAGRTMELWNHNATQLLASTQTNADGNYALSTVITGAMTVRVRVVYNSSSFTLAPMRVGDNPLIDSDFNTSGAFASFTDVIVIVANGTTVAVDAGLDPVDIQVGNFTWLDANSNGIQDAGEPGMPDIAVEIWNENRTVRYDTAISSEFGFYRLYAPGYGRYRLKFAQPAGATFTARDVGIDDLIDSDVIASGADTGWTPVLEFPTNLIGISTIDAGYLVPQAVDARVAYENVPGIVFPGSTANWTL